MSLTSDDLADIKQLMQAVVRAEIKDMDKRLDKMHQYMNDRFDEQDEKLDAIMDAVGIQFNEHTEQIDDHETRIVRLEKRAA